MENGLERGLEVTLAITTNSMPITLPLFDGTQVVVPDSPHLITPYVLREQHVWFEDEIKFLRKALRPGQHVRCGPK